MNIKPNIGAGWPNIGALETKKKYSMCILQLHVTVNIIKY